MRYKPCMAILDLSKIIKKYTNKWVALTSDNKKLVASGNSLDAVLISARKKGIENPSVFKVPNVDNLLVG